MKHLTKYFVGALALVASAMGFSSCQDHFDEPNPDQAPVASMKANTTIAELKQLAWSDKDNYCNEIYTKEWYAAAEADRTDAMKTEGTHIIVSGRVVSSDFAGNCFKYIVLQDETGALNFSINSYNLYLQYRRGQEVLVDITGLYMGKYRGLLQVGFPSYNSSLVDPNDPNNQPYETSFMAPEFFSRNKELNGWPNLADVDTIQVNSFAELDITPAGLRKWQSQLVRFNNVEFVKSDLETLSTYHSSGETQQIRDAEGNTIDIRTSGYANFWNMRVPEDKCDVVAILGYYVNLAGSGGWQLTLLDAASIMNLGNPSVPQGSETNPWSVQQAIALQANDENKAGWVKGYIVGTVAPGVETISSNNDIDWTDQPLLGNTLVIGETPETKDIAQCLVIELPEGSALRAAAALRENPGNYGKEIDLKGTFAEVMGTFGITGNNGTTSDFHLEGVTPEEPTVGDGSEQNPYNCAQVIAMNPSSTTNAVESGIWVSGYIVGYYQDYAAHFEAGGSQRANILISDNPSANAAAQCVCIQLVAQTATREALNLVDNPGVLGKQVSVFGDVMKYNTLPGIKNTSDYKMDGSGTPVTPPATGQTVTLLGGSDANGAANWTFDTKTKPASLQYDIWAWREYNSAYYLNGSAFTTPAENSEAWAISPVINTAGNTTLSVAFEHAAKFQTTLQQLCGFAVKEEGASAWTMLTIPTWPEAGSWTFVASGSIDLSVYAGKKIQVAFKYGSSAAGADTWEIKNLTFTSSTTPVTVEGAGSPVTPDDPVKPDDPVTPPVGGNQALFNFGDPTTLSATPALGAEEADGTTGNTKIGVNGTVFTSNGATVTDSGTGTEARLYHQASGTWTYRIYNKSTATITAPAGKHLVSVSFEPQTATHATNLGKCTFNSGTYADKVWTATGTSTTSLEINVTATVGLTSMTVTFE